MNCQRWLSGSTCNAVSGVVQVQRCSGASWIQDDVLEPIESNLYKKARCGWVGAFISSIFLLRHMNMDMDIYI